MTTAIGEPEVIVCGECGGVSTPPSAVDIHEAGCPQSRAAREERGETIEVDGEPALFRPTSSAPLIELSTDELIANVAEFEKRYIAADAAAKKAAKAKTDARYELDVAVAALTLRYANEHSGQVALPLTEAPAPPDEDALASAVVEEDAGGD